MSSTLKDELLRRGYTYNELVLDRVYKQYFSSNGRVAITKAAYYDYPFVTQTTKKVSQDKTLSYKFAALRGVNIPHTLQSSDVTEAETFLDTYKKVVVKPARLGGGKGLTVDITDKETLRAALATASANGEIPLIQEQFIGEEVRLTVIAGKVYSAILRRTPRVIGDGVSTIQQLIEKENVARTSLSFPFLTYPQLDASMMAADLFKSQTVPVNDEVVELSRATMIRKGASFYGVLDEVHPSYLEIAERLAGSLNPPMLIVDLMIKDFKTEATSDDYIFLEFNTAPALEIYSSLREGDQPDVISKFADLVDAYVHLCE